eukprot:CAMPEP_0172460174 /NCGR_PEP_ID=MMETSP1065-20121228/35834_1 /TAXON_ID=265537 /ORGANISM="Amphiprora paludosa, Strain CCMP125" /LENGTH=433 /DNA_ID=CAMNT_0013215127 /DNA_START=588 /DNA_END=1886 /DNA_ORIENTATION=-
MVVATHHRMRPQSVPVATRRRDTGLGMVLGACLAVSFMHMQSSASSFVMMDSVLDNESVRLAAILHQNVSGSSPSYGREKESKNIISNHIAAEKGFMNKIPWNDYCPQFEHDLLVPLFQSSVVLSSTRRVTIISEFFQATPHVELALLHNIESNHHLAHFVFLVGDEPRLVELQSILYRIRAELSGTSLSPATTPFSLDYDIYHAPGGVTYRHLLAAALPYSKQYPNRPFLIHNADISLGNMELVVNACPHLSQSLVIGSRNDIFRAVALYDLRRKRRISQTKHVVSCKEYKRAGSYDVLYTNFDNIECSTLHNLRFPPYYWGVENVVAHQLSRLKPNVANLCPYWNEFWHYHPFENETNAAAVADEFNSRNRVNRIRINHYKNDWMPKSREFLEQACNVTMLREYKDRVVPKAAMGTIRGCRAASPAGDDDG